MTAYPVVVACSVDMLERNGRVLHRTAADKSTTHCVNRDDRPSFAHEKPSSVEPANTCAKTSSSVTMTRNRMLCP
ncbi:MAG: hypothetical protein CMD83_05715 [Gammaproteobacteria bacterium]|nr:hypothetical protein [Gammaproteobacteria bacterium]